MREIEEALARYRKLGGETLVRKMVSAALDNASRRLEAAREATRTGDFEALELAAHSLKSSAANLGAAELRRLAGEVESLAARRSGAEVARLTELVEQLPGALADVSAYFPARGEHDAEDSDR